MKDRHLYRGQRVDNGEWVYGSYLKDYYSQKKQRRIDAIVYPHDDIYKDMRAEVIPETVGQHKNDNGFEFYIGDIAEYTNLIVKKGTQDYIKKTFQITDDIECLYKIHCLLSVNNIKITGSIHDKEE